MRHPRRALLIGLVFAIIGTIYWFVSYDPTGTAALLALGIAMGVMAYALAAASPTEDEATPGSGGEHDGPAGTTSGHGLHG